jgi:hypothetical protein
MTVTVDVPNLAAGAVSARRVAGILDDNATVAVAAMHTGDKIVTPEVEFNLGEALALSEACLSGDRRALTTPGLARILSASVAVLFRVSHAAGAFEQEGGNERDAGFHDNRAEAGGDEDNGD